MLYFLFLWESEIDTYIKRQSSNKIFESNHLNLFQFSIFSQRSNKAFWIWTGSDWNTCGSQVKTYFSKHSPAHFGNQTKHILKETQNLACMGKKNWNRPLSDSNKWEILDDTKLKIQKFIFSTFSLHFLVSQTESSCMIGRITEIDPTYIIN